jgi:hypothetical protein
MMSARLSEEAVVGVTVLTTNGCRHEMMIVATSVPPARLRGTLTPQVAHRPPDQGLQRKPGVDETQFVPAIMCERINGSQPFNDFNDFADTAASKLVASSSSSQGRCQSAPWGTFY